MFFLFVVSASFEVNSCAWIKMDYLNSLCESYLELARRPCSDASFAGNEVRFSSEYDALEAELAKMQSIHSESQPDWQKVIETSECVLGEHSKDLRVAVWLVWALYQRESFAGLLAGIGLLLHLCEQHWAVVYPLKLRTRRAAFGWLVLRLDPVFAKSVSVAGQQAVFHLLHEHLARLDECWSQHLGHDAPLLLSIRRQLSERLEPTAHGNPSPAALPHIMPNVKQVGAVASHKVDVRIIAATHRDLAAMVAEGSFREDLYYRLAQFPIELPALRDRDGDMLLLARHFAEKACVALGREAVGWSSDALDQLTNHDFPGNVRELKCLVERAVLMCDEDVILPVHLALAPSPVTVVDTTLRKRLERVERTVLIDCLHRNRGNRTRTARELGVARRTLLYRLARLNIPCGEAKGEC